jgi:ubiquinone/menaquinone biosynthesis C-methylase UbiE
MIPINEWLYLERLCEPLAHTLFKSIQVLDVGCGPGTDAEFLLTKGYAVTAMDIVKQEGAWHEREALGVRFHQASAENMPFANEQFEAVWIKDALHHMQNPLQALKECCRVIKPGGRVLVIEANRYNPLFYLRMTLIAGHQHFTRGQFKKLLQDTGYPFTLAMVESRCLPTQWRPLLDLYNYWQDFLATGPWFYPWLTYQIAVLEKR